MVKAIGLAALCTAQITQWAGNWKKHPLEVKKIVLIFNVKKNYGNI